MYLGDISPGGTLSVSGLSLSASSNALDSEETQLRVALSGAGGNNINWQYTLPLNFYSGNLFLYLPDIGVHTLQKVTFSSHGGTHFHIVCLSIVIG